MRVNGQPIEDYAFRAAPLTITYTIDYELEQARLFAGISAADFDAMPGTPEWVTDETGWRSKCHILMLYRMSTIIPAVSQDASARQMERDAKRRKF